MTVIIPAIEIFDGKCARLPESNSTSKHGNADDPLDVARRIEDVGFKQLHLADGDAAKAGQIINYKIVEKIASKTSLLVDFDGDVKSDQDLRIAFECGIARVFLKKIAI